MFYAIIALILGGCFMYDEREKLLTFSKRLQEEKVITFRLYNTLYKITFSHQKFIITQDGINVNYYYSTLKELLDNYIVYGNSLIDSIKDIKIC